MLRAALDPDRETATEGEIHRWEIHHPPERVANAEGGGATFLRVHQSEPHSASTYVTLFAESDPPGTPRLAMNLWPEQLDELIRDLQEARSAVAAGEE